MTMSTFELDIDGSEFRSSSIYRAIKNGDHSQVLAAIHLGENIHLRDQEFNSTYLHLITNIADSTSEEKYIPMIYQLSNAGIDVNSIDYKGRTALEIAISQELMEVMTALMRVGIDTCGKDYKAVIRDYGSPFEYEILNTFEKYEPGLWQCVKHNDTGMVHMLLNSWCRVNINKKGVTLIQYAKQRHKSEELITILDDFEVTLEFVHATLAGDEKRMLEFLMDSKPCDPHIMDISYQERWSQPLMPRSLRDTAIAMGHTHVLHLLPEGDSDDEDQGHGQGHKKNRDCSVTVMGVTSIAEIPSNDLFQEVENKQDTIKPNESQEYHFFHPTKFQQNGVNYRNHTMPPIRLNTPPLPVQTASYNSGNPVYGRGANEPLKIEEKCYYFHEVDGFAGKGYYQPSNKASIRRSSRSGGRASLYDYSHNWKAVQTKPHHKRSKMCVIS